MMADPGVWLHRLAEAASPGAISAFAGLGFAAIYFGLGGLAVWLTPFAGC